MKLIVTALCLALIASAQSPVLRTGHAVAGVLDCADTSSSATTYTCATTPAFTPVAGDMVLFTAINQSNSGTSTLSVNSAGNKTIKKQQNAANLASGDLAAAGAALMEYDGTYWQMQAPVANAAGSAGKLPATFLLCAGGCYVGETTNWKWTAPFAATFTGCVIDAVTYPTGAAVTVDLLKGGTTTIFSSAVPTLANGSSTYATDTGMAANAAFTQGQYLIASVLTAGSTIAGQFVNLTCTATY